MKVCQRCNAEKPLDDFPAWNRTGRNDKSGVCRQCINKRRLEQRRARGVKERTEYNEYMKDYRKKYRAEHPERICGSPAWSAKNVEKAVFKRMKDNARNNCIKCSMTYQEFLEEIGGAIPEVCPIFGTPLIRGFGTRSWDSPSVDRIDSAKPYEIGNIAVISYRANVIKSFGTAEEHRTIADWMDGVRAVRPSGRKAAYPRSANQQGAKQCA